ncbi:hypothetical protein C0989_008074 [Termitomyces sp. Mn162]|nr:hypothetical protein C0989_008074 [Termitomyces sp. Mn162]
MTTFMQNSSQTIVGNPYYNAQTGIAFFESMTGYLDDSDEDWIPCFKKVRETERVVAHSKERLSRLLTDDLDDLTQGFEELSLFRRRKAEVVLDPSLRFGSNVKFKETVDLGDGEVVPLVTLDDIKGSKVIISFPSNDSTDIDPPRDPSPTIGSESLSQSADMVNELIHTAFDILPERNEGKTACKLEDHKILPQIVSCSHSMTDIFPALRTTPPLGILERDVPALHLTFEGINNNASLPLLHTDTRNEQILAPGGTANPLVSQELLDHWNESLSSSSVQYPFEQTPALANLPFPFELPVSIGQSSQDLEMSFPQPIHDFPPGNTPTDLESQSYGQYDGSSSSDWSTRPNLSPSYTDSSFSQDSILCTPTSGQSLTFPSPQSILAAKPFPHSLPEEDVIVNISSVNPALLNLDTLHFEKPFVEFVVSEDNTSHPPVQKRPIQKAPRVHELIQAQVPPGPLTMKPKTSPSNSNSKGKGKMKVKLDADDGKCHSGDGEGDSGESRKKECKRKKTRNEVDKVRCEIEGCNGTFFSNWELKRHQENLHGIEKKTRYVAMCPKCGRHFASGRKDSVDRHIELNACGKRNPRKSPKRLTTGQTS